MLDTVCVHGVDHETSACVYCTRQNVDFLSKELPESEICQRNLDEMNGFADALGIAERLIDGGLSLLQEGQSPQNVLQQMKIIIQTYALANGRLYEIVDAKVKEKS